MNRKGDDDVLDIDELDAGTLDELGGGEGRKGDAAAGTPGGERGEGDDPRGETDVHALLKAERKAKKQLEQRLGRTNRELLAIREETRRQGEQLNVLTKRELARLSGSKDYAVSVATTKLRKAIDDGDSDSQIEAQRELARAEREADSVRYAISETEKQRPPAPAQQDGLSDQAQGLVDDWLAENAWFKMGGKDDASRIATAISEAIEEEGISPDDPKHFRELDRRLAKRLPERKGQGRKAPTVDDDDGDLDVAATPGSSRRGGYADDDGDGKARDPSPAQIRAYEIMVPQLGKWGTKKGTEAIRDHHARYSREKGVNVRAD